MSNHWIERYTYAVTRQLPQSQREDIERELRGMITDRLNDRLQGREATSQDVLAVLTELGDPRRWADRYRGRPRSLIGPELYPTYLTILTIVLSAVAIAMLVVFRNRHNVLPDEEGDFKEVQVDELDPGMKASRTFDEVGEFGYYCSLHGTPTKGMFGAIKVVE